MKKGLSSVKDKAGQKEGERKKQFIGKSDWETKDYWLANFEFNKYVCVHCKQEWNQAWTIPLK